jgi:hypothetical protein
LKIKLNCSWKFWRNWNVPFVLLKRPWWTRFDGIYLVRFGFKMWQINIFKWFLPLKFKINSKKPSFERKNLEDMVILGPMEHAILMWCGSWIHNILNLMKVHTNVMIKMMFPRNFISNLWNSHVTYVSCNVQLFKLL